MGNSLLELYKNGVDIETEYDRNGDRKSKDATLCMTIFNPLSEPRIHRSFPGGPEDLKSYVDEVCLGTKNHLIRNKDDKTDTRWQYTYNLRLFSYDVPSIKLPINQINLVAEKIAKCPNTRRAQAITWKVWEDNNIDDPACLQSLHFRGLVTSENSISLNVNIRMRSNDAYKAAFMNLFAFTQKSEKAVGFSPQMNRLYK